MSARPVWWPAEVPYPFNQFAAMYVNPMGAVLLLRHKQLVAKAEADYKRGQKAAKAAAATAETPVPIHTPVPQPAAPSTSVPQSVPQSPYVPTPAQTAFQPLPVVIAEGPARSSIVSSDQGGDGGLFGVEGRVPLLLAAVVAVALLFRRK